MERRTAKYTNAEKVILCDFDGTLFNGNIENSFILYLLRETNYRWRIVLLSLFTLPINLVLNKLYRPSLFKSWTYILKEKKIDVVIEFFNSKFFQELEGMTYNVNTIKMINSIEHDKMIILTGSDEDLVRLYLQKFPQIQIDDVIGSRVQKNYFLIKRHPYGKEKCKYVDTNKYSIGIANDYSDHFYMDICDEKYFV